MEALEAGRPAGAEAHLSEAAEEVHLGREAGRLWVEEVHAEGEHLAVREKVERALLD